MKGLRVKKAQWLVAKPLVSDKVEQTVHTKIRLFWGKKERTLSDVGSRGTMRERMKMDLFSQHPITRKKESRAFRVSLHAHLKPFFLSCKHLKDLPLSSIFLTFTKISCHSEIKMEPEALHLYKLTVQMNMASGFAEKG